MGNQEKPAELSYVVSCFFCGLVQVSEYWDVIEEHIMQCRDKASATDRGELGEWTGQDTLPIRCETELASLPLVQEPAEQERAA